MSIDRKIIPLGNGTFQLTDGTRGRLAYAVSDGARSWVFLDGRVYVVVRGADGNSRRPTAHDDDATALASPMPATVIEIKVAAGDRVMRGDVLITLEAMKMELPVKAPRDATIKAVVCRPGELVQPGVALLEIE